MSGGHGDLLISAGPPPLEIEGRIKGAPKTEMGAGIAASPHCPSYRRRRVAWRLPLGGSGRGRSEPRAVPRRVRSALARGPFPRGLAPDIGPASIPSVVRRARAPAGLRWFQPEAEASEPVPSAQVSGQAPPPLPWLPIEAGSDHPPSASDRSKLRSSAFRPPTGANPALPPRMSIRARTLVSTR